MSDVSISVAARTDVGRVRTNNEDAFTVTDLHSGARHELNGGSSVLDASAHGILLAVSDGMGGHEAGEVASALVLDSLRSAMQTDQPGSIEAKIDAAVRRANSDVAQAARADNKLGMGATLTAVLAQGSEAYVAEVGDSRAYLLRKGRLRQMTRDQSLVQMLVDAGVVTPEEAKTSPKKNVILQAMGLAADVRVAIGRLSMRRGDVLLICSDGISNALTDDEMRAALANDSPKAACDRLIDLANERGGEDNMTAIVAHFAGEGLKLPPLAESVTATYDVVQAYTGAPKKQGRAPAAAAAPAPPIAPAPAPAHPIAAPGPVSSRAAAPALVHAAVPAPAAPGRRLMIAVGLVVFVAAAIVFWLLRR